MTDHDRNLLVGTLRTMANLIEARRYAEAAEHARENLYADFLWIDNPRSRHVLIDRMVRWGLPRAVGGDMAALAMRVPALSAFWLQAVAEAAEGDGDDGSTQTGTTR